LSRTEEVDRKAGGTLQVVQKAVVLQLEEEGRAERPWFKLLASLGSRDAGEKPLPI
jgi:hypothetical protein